MRNGKTRQDRSTAISLRGRAAEPKAQTPRAWSLLHTLEMALRSYILGLTAGPVPGPSVAITAGRY
jgi:hypothetical protein